MFTRAAIDEFLSHKKLALLRATKKTRIQGLPMDKQLALIGYSVSVVYLEDADQSLTLAGLKESVDGVIIAVPQDKAEAAVKAVLEAKMPRIWIQAGSEIDAAIALSEKNNVPVVHGACVLMYAEPVKSFHGFHRGVMKMFGRMAK